MVASVVKNPTMIRVTLLCGRALSELALWRLLRVSQLKPHQSSSISACGLEDPNPVK